MRILSVRQKKLLDQVMKANPNIRWYDDLSQETRDKLDQLNLHENLESNVDRYINDSRVGQ